MSLFDKYYSKYMNTLSGFDKFHNEVINMPRDQFEDSGLAKIRLWAGYLLLTDGRIDKTGTNYKYIMNVIKKELSAGNYPCYRDDTVEDRYFNYEDLDSHYNNEGRMFRHIMSLCAFFGLITSLSKQKKIINYDKCKEYYLSDDKVLMPIARNNIVMLNAKDNDFIRSLKEISIDETTDYRPTYAILRYIHSLKRPATKFELSVLLGRIDDLKNEKDIIKRAIDIGNVLPRTQQQQIRYFFENMHWKHKNGWPFSYTASQEPYFKFNSYLLYMENFGLLEYDYSTSTYSLTAYSNKLMTDDISYLIADLEELLKIIDDYTAENSELNDLILYQRNPELLRLAKEDNEFIRKMNLRSINKPIFDASGKRIRNRLIAELAKIQADYKCQYAQRHIFKMPNGKYYCESHHIIEFSTENGPDITNNMIVLGPEAHMCIHHACREEVDDVFMQLTRNGVLNFNRFKEMVTVYHCLTKAHINILWNKRIITSKEKQELLDLLA